MFSLIGGVTARIFSNSFINVFQKVLTEKGERPSVVNFYTYLGLAIIGCLIAKNISVSLELLKNIIIMGILGAFGNYFIIKALSEGELSTLAPINAFKPVIGLVFGIFFLKEIPNLSALLGICLIIAGTFILNNNKFLLNRALVYRFAGLIFSAAEAIFIKQVIILSNINIAFFFWAISGLLFSSFAAFRHPLKIRISNSGFQLLLILSAALMQYSTNFVFARMNVAYALALFQLSVIISVFIGANLFHEKHIIRKLIASMIMIAGAVAIIV